MKRRLFNAGAGVSLVLCVAFISLWVRSYWWTESLVYTGLRVSATGKHERPTFGVGTAVTAPHFGSWSLNGLSVSWSLWEFAGEAPGWARKTGWRLESHEASGSAVVNAFGFAFDRGKVWTHSPGSVVGSRGLIIPFYPLVLLTAVLPVTAGVASWRRYRKARVGKCPACGYDLRGTPASECPECGAGRQGSAA